MRVKLADVLFPIESLDSPKLPSTIFYLFLNEMSQASVNETVVVISEDLALRPVPSRAVPFWEIHRCWAVTFPEAKWAQ